MRVEEFEGYSVYVSEVQNPLGGVAWLAAVYEGTRHLETYTVEDMFRQYAPHECLSKTQQIALKAIERCDEKKLAPAPINSLRKVESETLTTGQLQRRIA